MILFLALIDAKTAFSSALTAAFLPRLPELPPLTLLIPLGLPPLFLIAEARPVATLE